MWTSTIAVAALAGGLRYAAHEAVEVQRELYPDGTPRIEREVVRDAAGRAIAHGNYREFHPDGSPAVEGYHVDGERHRRWTAWHPDGRTRYRGVYSEGFRKGTWSFWAEDGEKDVLWSGDYEVAETACADGSLRSKGETSGGLRHGRWVFFWPDGGVKAEGQYVNDWIQGEWLFRHQDGTPDPDWISGVYEDGLRVGPLPEAARFELPQILLERLPVPVTDPKRRDAGDFLSALLALDPARDLANGRAAEVLRGGEAPRPEGSFWTLCPLPDAAEPDAAQRFRLLALRCHSLFALLEDSLELRWLEHEAAIHEATFALWGVEDPEPFTLFQVHPRLRDGSGHPFDGRPPFPYGDRPYPGKPTSTKEKPLVERSAVRLALDWLARHQDADGRWDCDGFMRHDPQDDETDGPGRAENDVGVTGLALLAFLGDGNDLHGGPHGETVARGLAWLVDQQDYESGLVGEKIGRGYLYGHAIATIALCEAFATSGNAVLGEAAQKAVNLISRARNPHGAWRYDSPPVGDNDTSVTTWMVCALQAAVWSGRRIDQDAPLHALEFLDEVTDRATGRIGYDTPGSVSIRYKDLNERYPRDPEAMTASGLFARLLLGQRPDDQPMLLKHAELLRKELPEWSRDGSTNDLGYWLFGSAAMHQLGEDWWLFWSRELRQALLSAQRKDGAFRGSWDPDGPWGWAGGRVYATAMAALALESAWRLEPLFARK